MSISRDLAAKKTRRSQQKRTELTESFIDLYGVRERIKTYLQIDQPFCLTGEQGIGKTTLLRECVAENKLVTVIGSEISVSELLGRYLLIGGETKWVDGILTETMQTGKTLYIDELPELAKNHGVMSCLHSLLDHRREVTVPIVNKTVKAHKDFRFVASSNYSTGSDFLSREFRDRLTYVALGRLDNEHELKLLLERVDIEMSDAEWLIQYAEITRNADPRNGASTRQIITAARAIAAGIDRDEAAFEAIVLPIGGSSRAVAQNMINALRAENMREIESWQIAIGTSRTPKPVTVEDGEVWS